MKTAKEWLAELDAEEKAHKRFRERAQKVVDAYEDEQDRDSNEFNILWSNVEVLHPALYAKSPNPDIRRRYLDRDKAGKDAAELAERAVSYAIDAYDFDGSVDTAIDDYLLTSLGVIRMRYEPYFETKPGDPVYLEERVKGYDPLDEYSPIMGLYNGDEEVIDYLQDENGFAYVEGEPKEEVVYEEVICEPVSWKKFRWMPAPRWEAVEWSAIEHYMTEDEIKEEYPDHYHQIPLGYTMDGEKTSDADEKARARVFEIFDKKNRKNIEIAEGYGEILKETEDPLNLEGFYPFPKPLLGTTKNGQLIPIPDYVFYQDQAEELDRVSSRINALTEQLKYRGVYDASFTALAGMENAEDGTFIAVADFQALINAGGGGQGDLNKVIATMPLEGLIRALKELYIAREQIKQTIYEITGIADIMRGSTAASETLGAQQLKTQFGSMRLGKRQRKVAQFVRDIVRLKVEIMVENFQPQTLEMMTGVEITEEIYQILTNDMMRSYRIDIETDSTVTEDAQAEKQGRIELVTAITGFFERVGPLVEAQIIPQNVATELLGFAVRGFKVGRTLEDTLDEMSSQDDDPRMAQMAQQVQMAQEQAQAYAEEQVQQVQEEAGREIEKLQGQIFELQKGIAIDQAADEAGIMSTAIKEGLKQETQESNAAMKAAFERFKPQ